MKNYRHALVRIPKKMDLALYLINEELKSTYFFNGLATYGIHDVWYQVHLASPILNIIGFTNVSDELLELYLNLIAAASGKISEDRDSLTRQSLKVYKKLRKEKKRLSKKIKSALF